MPAIVGAAKGALLRCMQVLLTAAKAAKNGVATANH